jgi:hypothetical protein
MSAGYSQSWREPVMRCIGTTVPTLVEMHRMSVDILSIGTGTTKILWLFRNFLSISQL